MVLLKGWFTPACTSLAVSSLSTMMTSSQGLELPIWGSKNDWQPNPILSKPLLLIQSCQRSTHCILWWGVRENNEGSPQGKETFRVYMLWCSVGGKSTWLGTLPFRGRGCSGTLKSTTVHPCVAGEQSWKTKGIQLSVWPAGAMVAVPGIPQKEPDTPCSWLLQKEGMIRQYTWYHVW